jgi:hypothetical protein
MFCPLVSLKNKRKSRQKAGFSTKSRSQEEPSGLITLRHEQQTPSIN